MEVGLYTSVGTGRLRVTAADMIREGMRRRGWYMNNIQTPYINGSGKHEIV